MCFPDSASGKELPANVRDIRDMVSIPGSGRYPGGVHGNQTQVFLPGGSYGQRDLTSYSPGGRKEPDMTEAT